MANPNLIHKKYKKKFQQHKLQETHRFLILTQTLFTIRLRSQTLDITILLNNSKTI